MKNHLKKLLLFTVFIVAMYSCKKDSIHEQVNTGSEQSIESIDQDVQPIQLGKKLEDPYTVENMKKAYESLKKSSHKLASAYTPNIKTTHIYIRFAPQDEQEAEYLERIKGLELYDYPFDYEIKTTGDYYHDPSISIDKPTYKYTTVPVDYKFPEDVTYEILSELYLPKVDINANKNDQKVSNFLEALEDESYIITNNETRNQSIEKKKKKYNPSGYIRIFNDHNGRLEGVPAVRARVRRWHEIRTTYTNNDGYFYISERFKRDVNYGVKYGNGNASIKPVAVGISPAFVDGPKTRNQWIYNSYKGSRSYLWGVIMRGVYDYHTDYAQRWNIGRPAPGLKIKACKKDCGSTTMMHTNTNILLFASELFSDVRIGHKDESYKRIYSTTIHELGHTAHWQLVGNQTIVNNNNAIWAHKMVREAWASGINDQVNRIKFGTPYYSGCKELQKMKDDGYPRVLIRDLIDNVNEFNPSSTTCNVNDPTALSGYTLNEIFYALKGAQGGKSNKALDRWRDNLIAKRPWLKDLTTAYFEQYKK